MFLYEKRPTRCPYRLKDPTDMVIGKKTLQMCLQAERPYRCAYKQKDQTDVLVGKKT